MTQAVLHVLQVEDSESDAGLVIRVLEKAGYAIYVKRVEEEQELRAALDRQTWDVIIADYRLPRFDGPSALRILHESGQDIPFIVVSGTIGEDLAVRMMKAGAHDYLLKNNLTRLAPAVEREIREARFRLQRRQSEEALRESEERLALAVNATHLGMFDYFPQTGKLIWSELAKRHFGLSAGAETNYETFLRGLHPDDRERVDGIVQNVLRPGSGGRYATEYRTVGIEDGIERRLSAWGRVYFDAQELPSRFIGVTLDITDRKRLEDQFLQAQKLESIGRLAGGVAHDFNNLLTVITGYAHMLLSDLPVRHPQRDQVQEISNAATRAADLTRQLLTFSRRHVTESKDIVLNTVVRDFQKMLGRLIGEDVQLVLSLDPEAGAVRADPGHIEQVLMNLAVNAKDAMPEGGKLIIETAPFVVDEQFAQRHWSVPPGRYVVLSVSDTGFGMTAEVKAHIFEPFFTTKELGKGTGLGLSTVYGIILQSGGTVSVYSEPGQGSTFRMLFPVVENKPNTAPHAADEENSFGNETVLLAEDELGVRRYVREILRRHGYTVLEASNGYEALGVARQHPGMIHLLVADAVMPQLGGLELSRQFRASRPGTPVLCMSGYSDRIWPEDNVPASYIQKPFTPAALLAKIRELLTPA
jgi:two-component system, cell cycle sensor histidine kinase and response regulator CckA